ncbi:MAG: DLW-39 family protein [Tetrasphaera jenkinsii]|jgi:hypothetical protein|uniref:Uncharacterized protein n=1 Tax=Nostocoides jenkinsii Ben 74 TaxID=1193518 RepID=A0A077MDL4_9MICO|nr:DLW-39 family protein [Tetrasphaera jenkinsii]MCI1261589.1 DLW-39 family protein [Tetrasphaera jenkinsii]CCI54005.1 conserved hypothetical protein [Tetrasphaera jenkinsii Ben 74]
MRKLLLVIATAVGATIVKKNLDRSKADKDLWAEATAPKPEAPTTPSSTPAS